MSAQNPAQPAQPAQPVRGVPVLTTEEDESGDETTSLLLYVVGGALVLLAFLAFLCVGFFVLGSFAAGHPLTDVFLSPVPTP